MGIQDRDYMKRRPDDDDDDDDNRSNSGPKAEDFLSRFLERNPRFLLYCGVTLGALIVIALIMAKR